MYTGEVCTGHALPGLRNRKICDSLVWRWRQLSISAHGYTWCSYEYTSSVRRTRYSDLESYISHHERGDEFVTWDSGLPIIWWPVWSLLGIERDASGSWRDLGTGCNRNHHHRLSKPQDVVVFPDCPYSSESPGFRLPQMWLLRYKFESQIALGENIVFGVWFFWNIIECMGRVIAIGFSSNCRTLPKLRPHSLTWSVGTSLAGRWRQLTMMTNCLMVFTVSLANKYCDVDGISAFEGVQGAYPRTSFRWNHTSSGQWLDGIRGLFDEFTCHVASSWKKKSD